MDTKEHPDEAVWCGRRFPRRAAHAHTELHQEWQDASAVTVTALAF